jgi:conjugative transfer signal peptidase TraF
MNVAAAPLVVGSAGLLLVAVSLQDHAPRIVWNASASVPVGLYAIQSSRPVRVGDLVAVRPPRALAAWLAYRGYLGRESLLLKRLAAVDGDVVCRRGRAILIEGRLAATARTRDRRGRPLPTWTGCRRLADGDIFLFNSGVPSSLDGRYFGPIDARSIVGVATPFWVAGG